MLWHAHNVQTSISAQFTELNRLTISDLLRQSRVVLARMLKLTCTTGTDCTSTGTVCCIDVSKAMMVSTSGDK